MDPYSKRTSEVVVAALQMEPSERAGALSWLCGGDERLYQEVRAILDETSWASDFLVAPSGDADAPVAVPIEVHLAETRPPALDAAPELSASPPTSSPAPAALAGSSNPSVHLSGASPQSLSSTVRAQSSDCRPDLAPMAPATQVSSGLKPPGGVIAAIAPTADDEGVTIVARPEQASRTENRFDRKRSELSPVNHPSIARIMDAGISDDGLPYLVTEPVDAEPIQAFCDRRCLPLRARLALFRQVCNAVQFAHEHLRVYGNTNPDAIRVTRDGMPKLMGFGMVQFIESRNLDPILTLKHVAQRGMPLSLASPEQVRGLPLGTAADVYSLGALLYALVSGHVPYPVRGVPFEDAARAICELEPRAPSAAVGTGVDADTQAPGSNAPTPFAIAYARGTSVQGLRRRLRGDLDAIVEKAMRKAPRYRYSTVEQLSEDVRRYLAGLPVLARRHTPMYRAGTFARRHRFALAAVAVAVALTTLAASSSSRDRVDAERRDRLSIGLPQAQRVRRVLEDIPALVKADGTGLAITVARILDDEARRLPAALAEESERRAVVEASLGRTYLGLGLYESAEQHLRGALHTYGSRSDASATSSAARVAADLAQVLLQRGNVGEAEVLLRRSLDATRRVRGNQHADTARALTRFGSLLAGNSDWAGAEGVHREALAIRLRLVGRNHAETAQTLGDLAHALAQQGRYADAEHFQRQATAVARTVHGTEHPRSRAAAAALASILQTVGREAEALELYEEALGASDELRVRKAATTQPSRQTTISSEKRREHERAEEIARHILSMRGRTLPDADPMVSSALHTLGVSLCERGRPVEGLPHLRESLGLRRRTLPTNHVLIGSSELVLAECLTQLGRFSDAEPLMLGGYATLRAASGDSDEHTLNALERVVWFYENWDVPELAGRHRTKLARLRQ